MKTFRLLMNVFGTISIFGIGLYALVYLVALVAEMLK